MHFQNRTENRLMGIKKKLHFWRPVSVWGYVRTFKHILTQFPIWSFRKYVESGRLTWWCHLFNWFIGIAEILEGTIHERARYLDMIIYDNFLYQWLLSDQGFFPKNWEEALAFHFGKFRNNFGQIGKKFNNNKI